ncbi:MAG: class I SAM-dependent methyltransferase [Saprospiraceae bacterium]|nr:class I SAM-dependent methyltransferase [Saprospiraceae bacterium]
MSVEQFFTLFLEELKGRDKLREYYKFHDGPAKLPFRKAYFCQRLQYVIDQVRLAISQSPNLPMPQPPKVWDCGCGYATTQIFLALNGIPSRGTTLEFYYKEIPERLEYWSKHGDMSLVKVSYEDVFETKAKEASEDLIIVQDTLHHLEPLQDSLSIFRRTLRPGGRLIAVEENGSNLVQSLKLYRQRGNNRIIEYYDEGLGRKVMMGNENIRPLRVWQKEFEKAGFKLNPESVQYVRLFPPSFFEKKPLEDVVAREQRIWKANPLLKEYFFFGINFVALKA